MAMNFWEAQRKARSRTKIYVFAFAMMTLFVAFLAEFAMREFAGPEYQESFPIVGGIFVAVTVGVALFNYVQYQQFGGGYVAESVGARLVNLETTDPNVRQLLNIIEEISVAASLPMPAVYLLEAEQINAFAAGLTPEKAAICVTTGALFQLNRDELQGVIAHEYGHVFNGDMRISMQLSAMLMGFFVILYIGFRVLTSFRMRSSRDDKGGGNGIMIAVGILMAAGAITWFFGSVLRAMVSREREYLADACAVQFTRNPSGIANALRKIAGGQVQDMPKEGMAFSHMYFDFSGGLFDSHPPIEKRIAAIEGRTYIPEEWKKDVTD